MGERGHPRASIDWRQVRERLERAARATETRAQATPERARAILEQRALALARRPEPAEGEHVEALELRLSGERYALEPESVLEVIRLAQWTPVPGAPDFLRGATNLRGEVLALVDVRGFFGLRAPPIDAHTRVLVCGAERPDFGLVVDEVVGLARIPASDLHDGSNLRLERREYVRGVTSDGLVLLQSRNLLGDPRLFVDFGRGDPTYEGPR